jgi:hypothetical protein
MKISAAYLVLEGELVLRNVEMVFRPWNYATPKRSSRNGMAHHMLLPEDAINRVLVDPPQIEVRTGYLFACHVPPTPSAFSYILKSRLGTFCWKLREHRPY